MREWGLELHLLRRNQVVEKLPVSAFTCSKLGITRQRQPFGYRCSEIDLRDLRHRIVELAKGEPNSRKRWTTLCSTNEHALGSPPDEDTGKGVTTMSWKAAAI